MVTFVILLIAVFILAVLLIALRLIKKKREQELRKWCVEKHFSMVRNEWISGIDYDSFYHYIKDGNKSEQIENKSYD